MDSNTEEIIATLNTLIETCKDGENGFRMAGEKTKNSELQTLFQSYSRQRALFASELQDEVRSLGGDPEKGGSVAGSLHRGWMNIKAAVAGSDDEAMIAECERGEDAARKNYEEALKETLPEDIRTIVLRQYTGIKEAHDRIRALELAVAH